MKITVTKECEVEVNIGWVACSGCGENLKFEIEEPFEIDRTDEDFYIMVDPCNCKAKK